MHIEVHHAQTDEAPVLANLLELYAHDFTEFVDLQIGTDGRFGYPSLPLYWQDANRFPFLIRVNGELAGFVLVQQGSQVSGAREVRDVAEFFVLRRYRRQGVGVKAAHAVWQMFTGPWEVRVIERNVLARHFWQRAISEFTRLPAEAKPAEVDGQRWHVFSFVSRLLVG